MELPYFSYKCVTHTAGVIIDVITELIPASDLGSIVPRSSRFGSFPACSKPRHLFLEKLSQDSSSKLISFEITHSSGRQVCQKRGRCPGSFLYIWATKSGYDAYVDHIEVRSVCHFEVVPPSLFSERRPLVYHSGI